MQNSPADALIAKAEFSGTRLGSALSGGPSTVIDNLSEIIFHFIGLGKRALNSILHAGTTTKSPCNPEHVGKPQETDIQKEEMLQS